MKTPAFWHKRGALSTALLPVAALYEALTRRRYGRMTPLSLSVPVICIGNVTAGGAGKTPVALAVGARLNERGIHAFYLSRGYGGKCPGPVLVDPARHGAAQVGDEPLLLARLLPTVVARDRVKGAQLAQALGAKAIIMDDGFQNPSLHKTLSLLVVDGVSGLGNGRLLPAGPLRERWPQAVARAQAVVVVNPAGLPLPAPPAIPLLTAHTQATQPALALHGRRVLAFCGLAIPEKFFATVEALGAELVERVAFADHHRYTGNELAALAARADAIGAQLVTTEKDAVRLPPLFADRVAVVAIRLVFDHPATLDGLLDTVFDAKKTEIPF